MDAIRWGSWHGMRVGLMLVTGAWSVSALAASGPTCDNSGRRLQTLNVSVEALAPETVEHVGVAAETTVVPAPPDAVNEAIAPLLYLTPHIAAILNSVFESTESTQSNDNTAPDRPQPSPGPVSEASKAPTAASAPQATTSDTDDGSAPANAVFRNDDIARFQRQMYRKDI